MFTITPVVIILLLTLAAPCRAADDPSRPGAPEPAPFDEDHHLATVSLLKKVAGADTALTYADLPGRGRLPYLREFWRARNPVVWTFYFGHYAGERRYSVSDAFFEQDGLIPTRYHCDFEPVSDEWISEALDLFGELIERLPTDPVAQSALGYALLEARRFEEARGRFIRALELDDRFAEARNGVGLALLSQKLRKTEALNPLREAVAEDPEYQAAWYALAICHLAMGAIDVDHRFRQVVGHFPDHHDAHFKLGVAYEEAFVLRKAAGAYTQQILKNPNHDFARDRLARVNLEMSWTNDRKPLSIGELEILVDRDRGRYLPILAEAHLGKGNLRKAGEAYARYLRVISDDEETRYQDVSLIATDKENRALEGLTGEARERYLVGFWLKRDPTPTSPVNERKLEHYRRIHYALQNYADATQPWDQRGEVYIRLGHPDHRSWSTNLVFETNPSVVRVKNRLNDRAGSALSEIIPSDLNLVGGLFQSVSLQEIRGFPIFPVPTPGDLLSGQPSLNARWELWIYARVAGGIEITFVDYLGTGVYDFARVPEHSSYAQLWLQIAPETVFHRAISDNPSHYHYDYGGPPLDLAVGSAQFRAGHESALEVYLAVPWRSFPLSRSNGGFHTTFERKVVVYDARGKVVFDDSLHTEWPYPESVEDVGSILADQVRKKLEPGRYYVAVKVTEPVSHATQIFRQTVDVRRFSQDNLDMSSVEIASLIRPAEGRRKSKFRKGEVEVIPLPTSRVVSGRPVHLYYEVYNLLDTGGHTRYRVDYRVRGAQPAGVRRLLGRAARLLRSGPAASAIQVSYVHEGETAWEPVYVALDLAKITGDAFDIEVSVTDLRRNEEPTVSRAITVHRED